MSDKPIWLPDMVSTNGDFNVVIKLLYSIFTRDFITTRQYFRAQRVIWDYHREPGDPYENGFWHLVTRDDTNASYRPIDTERAKRLPWCGPVIANSGDICLRVFSYPSTRGRIRYYVWLWEYDYVVVLEPREKDNLVFLVTAYHVDGEQTRRKLLSRMQDGAK